MAVRIMKQQELFRTIKSTYNLDRIHPGLLKSGWQKAYRRNDVAMFDWMFDALWQIDPKWLIWRALILPAEENWQFCLPVGQTLYALKQKYGGGAKLVNPETKETLKAVMVTAMSSAKDKDGDGARTLAEIMVNHDLNPEDELSNEEDAMFITEMMNIHRAAHAIKSFKKEWWGPVWVDVDELKPKLDPKEYQNLRAAVGACYFRGLQGGMLDDQIMLYVVASLFLRSYWDKGYVEFPELCPDEQLLHDSLGDTYIADPGRVPWFMADMHTSPGIRTVGWTKKKEGYDKDQMDYLWFYFESARVNATAPTSVWWDYTVEFSITRDLGLSVPDARKLWETELAPLIRSRVTYLMQEDGTPVLKPTKG